VDRDVFDFDADPDFDSDFDPDFDFDNDQELDILKGSDRLEPAAG